MSIAFQCDQCGKRYVVKDDLAGKLVKCKECAKGLRIPAPGSGGASRPSAAVAAPAPPALDIYGLDEPTQAQNTSAGGDEEEAPPLPRAAAPSRGKTRQEKKAFEKRVKANDRQKSTFSQAGFGASFGAVVMLALFCLKFYNRVVRPLRGVSRVSASAGEHPGQPLVRQAGPITTPAFPDPGPGMIIGPGIRLREVRLGPPDPAPASPGHRGKLWLYEPDGPHEPRSLPCVLMAGAGSNLISGMDLGAGDRPEHLPYVHAGFAVLAYELDGAVPEGKSKDEAALIASCAAFLAAQAGLVNARNALDFLAARVPEVDPERVYTAGHSSAGTMALLLAENEPRIKGCVAFAPVVDMTQRIPTDLQGELVRVVPGAEAFFSQYNPRRHEDGFQGPVFLFHAQDDSNVPVSESLECKARLEQLGKSVTLVVVPTGNHYQSMIAQGIPRAVAWLCKRAGLEAPESASAASAPPPMRPAGSPFRGPRSPRGPRGPFRPRPGGRP